MSEAPSFRWLIWPFMDSEKEATRLCMNDPEVIALVHEMVAKYDTSYTSKDVGKTSSNVDKK